MEIPQHLKFLYNHWEFHTISPRNDLNIEVDSKVMSQIFKFITERQLIWERKQKQHQDLTNDLILKNYKFCNIYRELDRQTIEIHTLLKTIQHDFNLWLLNLAFNRFLCRPETFKDVGSLSFNESENTKVLEKLKAHPRPKFGSAYIFPISIIQSSNYKTREEFFCLYLPKVIKNIGVEISKFKKVSVVEALERILPILGFNFRFHFTEILIDIAYQFPLYIDLFKEFPIGPGSIPTMKSIKKDSEPSKTCLSLINTVPQDFPYLTFEGKSVYLSAENWEGIGCEYRKYTNLKIGKGRKRLFGRSY